MKKSVIFIISIMFFLSVYIVTLFGMKIKIDQFAIYMTDLGIQQSSYDKIDSRGVKTKTIQWEDNADHITICWIDCKPEPSNASFPEAIKFSLSGNVKEIDNEEVLVGYKNGVEEKIAKVEPNGRVTFFNPGSAIVRIYSVDGSGLEDKIQIFCLET